MTHTHKFQYGIFLVYDRMTAESHYYTCICGKLVTSCPASRLSCVCFGVCCKYILVIYKNHVFTCMRSRSSSLELMQQAPESSSWFGSGWHAPPPSSAFFLSSCSQSHRGSRLHMEDSPPSVLVQTIVSWQTLNNRCPPFLSHASRCNVHLASHPNLSHPLSFRDRK